MPRIELYESRVAPQGGQPALVPVRPGEASTWARIADAVADLGERASRAQSQAEATNALLLVTRQFGDLRTAIERDGDTDFTTRRSRFDDGAAGLIQDAARRVGGSGRAAFIGDASRLAVGQSIEVQRAAYTAQSAYLRAGIDSMIEEAAIRLADPATSEQDRAFWQGQVTGAIEGARGIIDPVWLTNAQQRFRRGYSTNMVIAWAGRTSPMLAYQQLQSGRIADPQVESAWRNMTPQEQLTLRRTVLGMARELSGIAADGRASAERAGRSQIDALTNRYIDARENGDEGGMNDALDALARVPGGSARRLQLSNDRASGAAAGRPSDPNVLTMLTDNAARGVLTRQDLDREFQAGRVSHRDFRELTVRLATQGDQRLQAGIRLIESSIGAPPAAVATLTTEQAAARARATRRESEIRQWAMDNPGQDPTAEVRRIVAEEGARRTAVQANQDALQALPAPLRDPATVDAILARRAGGSPRYRPEYPQDQLERARALQAERRRLTTQ